MKYASSPAAAIAFARRVSVKTHYASAAPDSTSAAQHSPLEKRCNAKVAILGAVIIAIEFNRYYIGPYFPMTYRLKIGLALDFWLPFVLGEPGDSDFGEVTVAG